MSGACSPLSVGTDREGNMGDVLGKEPEGREDQLSDHFGENMEREEAEGAEAEEERSPDSIKVSPVLNLDPGDADQVRFLTLFLSGFIVVTLFCVFICINEHKFDTFCHFSVIL